MQSEDGTTTRPAEAWVPLGFARPNEAGQPSAVLGSFSTYGANAGWDGTCEPTQAQLTPGPTPEGYIYMGTKVFINQSMDTELSTLPPLFPPHSPTHISELSSTSVSRNSETVCTITVEHLFVPEGSVNPECIPSAAIMNCPPPGPNEAFVGYDLVLNGVLLKTTVDLNRPEKPTDVNHISSETEVVDGVVVCDFILRCLYEPLPAGGSTLDAWSADDATLPEADTATTGGSDVGPTVTREWEPYDDLFDWEVVWDLFPPPGDGDIEYTPDPFGYSLYPYTTADAAEIGHSSPFILYIDYTLGMGEIGATFMQIKGADHYGIATNAEIQTWGDAGQASVVLKFTQGPGTAEFVGEHTLVVALAGSDGAGGWDPALVSQALEIPVTIGAEDSH